MQDLAHGVLVSLCGSGPCSWTLSAASACAISSLVTNRGRTCGPQFSLSCGRAMAAASQRRVRKPLTAVLIANSAYLAVAVMFASGPSAVWDQLLAIAGVDAPSRAGTGTTVISVAQRAADGMFEVLFMSPMLLLVTILSTVWWTAMAKPASAATRGPPVPIAAAETAIKVSVLLLVQLEAALLDMCGRALTAWQLHRAVPCVGAASSTSNSLNCLGRAVMSPLAWLWVAGWVLRLAGLLGLCAAYSFMAVDPARAAAGRDRPEGSRALAPARLGEVDRLLAADRELPWLVGCGLFVTGFTVATSEWLELGLHAGTAVYGIMYSLLAAVAVGGADSPAPVAAANCDDAIMPGTPRGLFAFNARFASWVIHFLL